MVMMTNMVRNLIFDVGNVLIGYRWFEMPTEDFGLSSEEANRIGNEMFENDLWGLGLDGGRITLDEAILEYGKLYPQDIRVMEWFLRNGERMAVKRPEIWEKVIGLKKKGYNIYILSNYSKELFEMHTKDASFLKVLDGGIVSYQVKEIKPGRRIYELLLEKYDLKAEECLFFDDRADNVEAARNMGIEAIQVTSREMLNEILDKMLSE